MVLKGRDKIIGRKLPVACGPGECGRSTSRAGGACEAAPDEALRTIRPAPHGAGLMARRLRRSPPRHTRSFAWENANGSFAAALYPYNVIVRDSVVGVHSLANSGDIFGCICSYVIVFGDGVLSSIEAILGIDSFSLDDVESSGWTFCLDTVAVGFDAVKPSLGVDR